MPLSAEPINVPGIKSHLVGLDPWLRAAATSEAGYNEDAIQSRIPAMISLFEKETQYRVHPVQVACNPDGVYATPGATLDVSNQYEVLIDPPYPYIEQEAEEFFFTYLRWRPILQFQRCRLMLDPSTIVMQIPDAWNRVEPRSGRYSIMPVSGGMSIIGATTAIAALRLAFGYKTYMPQVVCFDYIAGLPVGWEQLRHYADLKIKLEEYAAYRVLCDISELFDAGKLAKTISADGLTQTTQYSRFEKRKAELYNSVMAYEELIKAQDNPLMFGTV